MKKNGKRKKGKSNDSLIGINEISDYYGRAYDTLIFLALNAGFPMRKICGIWESSKAAIDEWKRGYVNGDLS